MLSLLSAFFYQCGAIYNSSGIFPSFTSTAERINIRTYLVVEVDEKDGGYDPNQDQPGPVRVIDRVGRVLPHVRDRDGVGDLVQDVVKGVPVAVGDHPPVGLREAALVHPGLVQPQGVVLAHAEPVG